MNTNEPAAPNQPSFAKPTNSQGNARLPSAAHTLLPQSELKKTPTSGLRTPTAVKELRASPSKAYSKGGTHVSNPINTFATNQPMPLYGQGQAPMATPSNHASMDPKSITTPSGTSPFPAMSPYAALKMYASYLSLYERAEIGEFPQVYYVGQNCRQKRTAGMDANNSNFGTTICDYWRAFGQNDNWPASK
jgi:dual specificity tyrosine-phosphorylation-regulated kinase 2/3/4